MTTLLFDIDGTLVRTGGAGKAAMEAALRDAFGVTVIRDEVPFGGRTDPAIGHDLLRVHGFDATAENYTQLSQAYLEALPACLDRLGGNVCPGIRELLPRLATRPGKLGLLTGNARLGAMRKLNYFGLWDFFTFGGFGDHHHDRDDVARSALDSAGSVDRNRLWVIGDTPLDVKCARAIGAKAVAVATGWVTEAELAAAQPDLLLRDLSDWDRLPRDWFD